MNTFLQLELILYPATVAVAALTRQGALRLLQVEDLVEGSLLGAVGAARLLLPVDPARDGGEAAPGNHRLDLCGGGQDEVKMARRRGGGGRTCRWREQRADGVMMREGESKKVYEFGLFFCSVF